MLYFIEYCDVCFHKCYLLKNKTFFFRSTEKYTNSVDWIRKLNELFSTLYDSIVINYKITKSGVD